MREFENLLARGYTSEGAARSINARFGPSITSDTTSRTLTLNLSLSEVSAVNLFIGEFRRQNVPRTREDQALSELAKDVERTLDDAYRRGIDMTSDVLTIELSMPETVFLHGLVSRTIEMNEPSNPVLRGMFDRLAHVQAALERVLREA